LLRVGGRRRYIYIHERCEPTRPLGGRHAAVIPALPEEYDASVPMGPYYVPDRERDKDRRDVDEKTMSPNLSHAQQQQLALQPGLTQIVLPPPTTSETLNIQEYQPPAPLSKEKGPVEKRVTRMSARAASPSSSPYRKASLSPTPYYPPPPHAHGHHTRSASQASRMREESSSSSPPLAPAPAPQPSPYMTTAGGVANTSGGSSSSPPPLPPPVPATFASIMNAYPAPAATSRPGSRAGFDANGSGGSGGDGGDE
jgi:hypothetical protein